MTEYEGDRWSNLFNNRSGNDRDLAQRDFIGALRDLERFSDKVRRFYQSGDFDEVILNVHRIREIYQLCVDEGQNSATVYDLNKELRARIDQNAPTLDYWWEMGVVAFRRIKIGPEIAEQALMLSEDMHKYTAGYLRYRSRPELSLAPSTAKEVSHTQSDEVPPITQHAEYLGTLGVPESNTGELLYVARPSVLGCTLKSKSGIVLLIACLFSSFFVRSVIDISMIATLLRTAAVLLFLLIAMRAIIAVYSEQYEVTTRTICVMRGLLLRKKVRMPIDRIAKQRVQQSLAERVLKIGNLFIRTYSGHIIAFTEIRDPQEVSDLIGELRKNALTKNVETLMQP